MFRKIYAKKGKMARIARVDAMTTHVHQQLIQAKTDKGAL